MSAGVTIGEDTLKSSSPADRLRWLGLSLVMLLLDQATKYAASTYLAYGERRAVTEFFSWIHLHNTGAAFSFLADAGGWQRGFLIGVPIVISVMLLGWLWSGGTSKGQAIALSAILGGALGNLTDRLLRGHVVDFLDVHYAQYHWPAFNLADVWITTGAALLIWAHRKYGN